MIASDEGVIGRYSGIDPQTAAAELRGILAASGAGSKILAQRSALKQWAFERGRLFGPQIEINSAQIGGLEHYIWFDESFGVVRKHTYGGAFGRTVRRLAAGLVPATPLEYLDRWKLHNDYFGVLTSITGVLIDPSGDLKILIEQIAIRGELPKEEAIEDFLGDMGFVPLREHRFAWTEPATGLRIFDARPANFVSVESIPIPFDLVLC